MLDTLPLEAVLMMKVAGGPHLVGQSAAVTLLDWYDLDQEILLIMERPVPSVDLLNYINSFDCLTEDQAKVLKLVAACFYICVWCSLKTVPSLQFSMLSVSVES